jgi:carboxymethylenebutenolidase
VVTPSPSGSGASGGPTHIPGGGTPQLRGYLARPQGAGPWPGVVVLHEVLGLNDDVRRATDRFAAAGYLALAPDLLSGADRRGTGTVRCLVAVFRALRQGEGPAVDDVLAARAWLAGHDDSTGVVGVAGFCLGGGFALLLAARGFDACAPCYGPLPDDLEGVLAGSCPVVASYGGRDPSLRGAAQRLEEVLTGLGVEHDVREYPGAGHAFLSDHRTGALSVLQRVPGLGHHAPSAADAWARILAFFDVHLRR